MKYELKCIDTWSAVKIAFVICGAVGFLSGALYAMLITFMASFFGIMGIPELGNVGPTTGLIAVIAWIVMPVFYAVCGAILVALFSWFYNVVARIIGGINLTFEAQPIPKSNSKTDSSPDSTFLVNKNNSENSP